MAAASGQALAQASGAGESVRSGVIVAIVALSALMHLWRLGLRPLSHDEAIDAWFSWAAGHGDIVRYNPVYHGPLRFHLEGLVLTLFGSGAFYARLVAALAGIATTAVIAMSRRVLGTVGAPAAALLFTVSPTALTVTRTGREDALVALVSVALLLLVAGILVEPRQWQVVSIGPLLAVSFGLKETTFLFGLAATVFVAGALVVAALKPDGQCRRAVRRLLGLGYVPWVWTALGFIVVFAVVFTSAFRYADGLTSGLIDGVRYWWSQHGVGRGGQPWFFYLVIYLGYEWLTLGLAAVGTTLAVRRRSLPGIWFASMAIGQFVLFSWAGEKFAWLALHPLLPAFLLGGLGAQVIVDRADAAAWQTRALIVVGSAAVLMTVVVAVRPAITDGADARELLVTVQTSTDVPAVVKRLHDGVEDGSIDSILIDDSDGASWPWAWYLHDLDGVSYATVDPNSIPPGFDAAVVVAGESPPDVPDGFRAERLRLRVWWQPDYDGANLGDAVRWFFTRRPWSPTGSFDEYLITRE